MLYEQRGRPGEHPLVAMGAFLGSSFLDGGGRASCRPVRTPGLESDFCIVPLSLSSHVSVGSLRTYFAWKIRITVVMPPPQGCDG